MISILGFEKVYLCFYHFVLYLEILFLYSWEGFSVGVSSFYWNGLFGVIGFLYCFG